MQKKHKKEKRIFGMICAVLMIVLLAAPAFAEEQSPEYWERVEQVQRQIRTGKTLKYGMTPVFGISVADGTYDVAVWSNSTYFKIENARLTVKGGAMTAEITIPSMSYLYVYPGTGVQAKAAEEKSWIGFRGEDGKTVFEIPVPALNTELPCAAYSKARKKWYDRLLVFDASSLPEEALKISLPDYDLIEDALKAYGADEAAAAENFAVQEVPQEEEENPDGAPGSGQKEELLLTGAPEPVSVDLSDGEYSIEVNMVGGSGRASISSPTWLTVKDGKAYAKLLWSSAYYDYLILGDQTFYNETKDGGNSSFVIPIAAMDEAIPIIADTTAMGDPVEIRYELTFYSETIGSKSRIPQEAAVRVLIIAAAILIVGGVLNVIIKRKKKK